MEELKTTLGGKPTHAGPADSSRDANQETRSPETSASTSSSSPWSAQPGAAPRTASAPLVRLSKDGIQHADNSSLYSFETRDSLGSIRDDPFFKNYQTPKLANISREMRSLAPGGSTRITGDNSVNLPVCLLPSTTLLYMDLGLMEIWW